MRTIDTLLKKTMPVKWYNWKQKRIYKKANEAFQ
jgi:hypothetical protein